MGRTERGRVGAGEKGRIILLDLFNSFIIQALDLSMHKASYLCLEHSLPVMCFGDGRDLELALYTENSSLPLATQVLPLAV